MRVEPRQIIECLVRNDGAIRVTAGELGISPSTVINWKRRAKAGYRHKYLLNVKRQSTAPHTIRSRTGTSILATDQDAILALRRERGYGAGKIKAILKLGYSEQTIHRFLKRRGLTAKVHNYRRPRLQGTKHMYLKNVSCPGKLQMDIKYVTPELSGLVHTTYLYAVIDIYTRWKFGVILDHLDQELCIRALKYILPRLPDNLRSQIDFIQTDNGLEFQERFHRFITDAEYASGLSGNLGKELGLKHQLKHHYIHKSSPNENAVIERSFRTDEEEFFWRISKRPLDIEELNEWYEDYINDYNTYRPHMGLDYMTPEEKLREYFNGTSG